MLLCSALVWEECYEKVLGIPALVDRHPPRVDLPVAVICSFLPAKRSSADE